MNVIRKYRLDIPQTSFYDVRIRPERGMFAGRARCTQAEFFSAKVVSFIADKRCVASRHT